MKLLMGCMIACIVFIMGGAIWFAATHTCVKRGRAWVGAWVQFIDTGNGVIVPITHAGYWDDNACLEYQEK